MDGDGNVIDMKACIERELGSMVNMVEEKRAFEQTTAKRRLFSRLISWFRRITRSAQHI
jgi:hypothetical protein